MATTLLELAHLVDGELTGSGDLVISGAATLRTAQPDEITLAEGPTTAAEAWERAS